MLPCEMIGDSLYFLDGRVALPRGQSSHWVRPLLDHINGLYDRIDELKAEIAKQDRENARLYDKEDELEEDNYRLRVKLESVINNMESVLEKYKSQA